MSPPTGGTNNSFVWREFGSSELVIREEISVSEDIFFFFLKNTDESLTKNRLTILYSD